MSAKFGEKGFPVKTIICAFVRNAYQESVALLLRAKEIRERLLGKEHPNTAKGYNSLGYLYEELGRSII